ncbi:hypothetical protein H4R20_001353 [Coemansia guatemalensis]|uniref:Proteasome assembly chaperone 2 n=1 Tax=Coemansia guatemalensis TaxID=2761395 RepID=A0A9W8HZL0_9FUNG|nr:hypothetical protein H4R20_001353 [Coemansia guatemalensis]
MFVRGSDNVVTKGSTLVLPSVSIGNVPQLAVDLLINTLQASRVGILDSSSVMPISGPSGFDHLPTQRSVPVEVYQSGDAQWTIIQQRSPPLPKHHRIFAQEVMDFIGQGEFSKVVLLTSSDAALRADALIDGPQIRSLAINWQDELLASRLQALSLGPLSLSAGITTSETTAQVPLDQLHAAGISKHLLRLCQTTKIPVLSLVALANEGDNVPDAINLANATNALLELAPNAKQWCPPRSWEWLMAPGMAPSELF